MLEILIVIAIYGLVYVGMTIFTSVRRKRKISRLESEREHNMDNVE